MFIYKLLFYKSYYFTRGFTMNYDEIYDKAKQMIAEYLRVDENEITPKTNLVDDFAPTLLLWWSWDSDSPRLFRYL